MPYTIVRGNLLDSTEQFIVQQTCCTAIKPHGLSACIAAKWPSCNPYSSRRKAKGNWAIADDRPTPGTIQLMDTDTDKGTTVICAFAQYCHGKPGVYKHKDPLGLPHTDSLEDRFRYFQDCLLQISTLLQTKPTDTKQQTIAFPYRIGCGLAGGSWPRYEAELKAWSDANPAFDVKLYQL